MPARLYDNLGAIQSVTALKPTASSKRSTDHDRTQTFSFECEPLAPFTGIIVVQSAVDDPTGLSVQSGWFDLCVMDFVGDTNTTFIELTIESASVRVICRRYDRTVWVSRTRQVVAARDSQIKIDAISVTISQGMTASQIVDAITNAGIPNIEARWTRLADILTIHKTDGTTLTLQDEIGSFFSDFGMLTVNPTEFHPNGRITNVRTMR